MKHTSVTKASDAGTTPMACRQEGSKQATTHCYQIKLKRKNHRPAIEEKKGGNVHVGGAKEGDTSSSKRSTAVHARISISA
jgi:hypothetical protein